MFPRRLKGVTSMGFSRSRGGCRSARTCTHGCAVRRDRRRAGNTVEASVLGQRRSIPHTAKLELCPPDLLVDPFDARVS